MIAPRKRRIAALLLGLLFVPALFVRTGAPRPDHGRQLTIRPLDIAAGKHALLGPFRLEGAWQLRSRDWMFGGYSALLARPRGMLLAFSDRGSQLLFREPPGDLRPYVMSRAAPELEYKGISDAEGATQAPDGTVWLSWEHDLMMGRLGPDLRLQAALKPAAIQRWSDQFGGESFARLADGRFLLVSEEFVPRRYQRDHETLVYPSDPVGGGPKRIVAAQPTKGVLHVEAAGYRPTDMALLPDGRALILLRQLVWPFPMRFSARIALADPADLIRTGRWTARDIAWLDPPLPTDNYEGLAVRPRADGQIDVWLISDDNRAASQRTLLLKFRLNPTDLPKR